MNPASIVVIVIVAALLALAIRNIIKNRQKGGCAGCSGCTSGCEQDHTADKSRPSPLNQK